MFPFESSPLRSFEDLLKWKPGVDPVNISRVDLKERIICNSKPKVICCHDFKGGYVNDKHSNLGSDEFNIYNFQYWDLVDTFIYFSHSFITIPPPCWTECSHQNGVKILGTMITEWKAGKLLLKEFLEYENRDFLVNQLVSISSYYGFDGWFVNIENSVDDVPSLLDFLKKLNTSLLESNGKTLLWYDSVIKTGQLKWQDSLNSNNIDFFNCCNEGIFLNYTYNLEKIIKTEEFIIQQQQSIKDKVYFGIDCFGRNTFGGGKFDVDKAIEVHQKKGFQIAIFAPGWTFEQSDGSRLDFENREKKFWEQKILPFINPRNIKITETTIIVTNFSTGIGKNFWMDGEECCVFEEKEKEWSNLRIQSIFPVVLRINPFVVIDYSDAWNGGNCIRFIEAGEYRVFKIMQDIQNLSPLEIEVLVKLEDRSKIPYIVLETEEHKETITLEVLENQIISSWNRIRYSISNQYTKKKEKEEEEEEGEVLVNKKFIKYIKMIVYEKNMKLGSLKILKKKTEEEENTKMEILKYLEKEGNIYVQWKRSKFDNNFGYYNVFCGDKKKKYLGSTKSNCCVIKNIKDLNISDFSKDINVYFVC